MKIKLSAILLCLIFSAFLTACGDEKASDETDTGRLTEATVFSGNTMAPSEQVMDTESGADSNTATGADDGKWSSDYK